MLRYCVDLDNTLAKYKRGDADLDINKIGDPIPGAKEFVDNLARHIGNDNKSARIIIFTRRVAETQKGPERETLKKSIAKWLNKHGFYWNEIYDDDGKPDGTVFIDDRGVQCRPEENPNAYKEAEEYIKNVILTYR